MAPTPPVEYPAVANGVVYVAAGNDIDAFDASDGTLLWHSTASSGSGPGSIAEGMVFDVSADGVLHAYGL